MTSLSLHTRLEALPSKFKREVKRLIEEMLENKKNKKESARRTLLKKRSFGSLKGKIHLADDFDAPLNDFKDYM